jgi:MFS family permease
MRSRNVILLAFCQALGMSGPTIVVLLSGIIGADIAPNPSLATLPISLGVVSMALASIPGAPLMRRIGRKRGFIIAALIAAAGALLAALAISQRNFPLFCLAIFLIGQNNAFVLQYRFAAAESVDQNRAGRAVSLVLVGGILAGFIGPEVAKRTQGLLPGLYAGSFAALAVLYLIAIAILLFLQDVRPAKSEIIGSGRPLGEIARQPNYQVALL